MKLLVFTKSSEKTRISLKFAEQSKKYIFIIKEKEVNILHFNNFMIGAKNKE